MTAAVRNSYNENPLDDAELEQSKSHGEEVSVEESKARATLSHSLTLQRHIPKPDTKVSEIVQIQAAG